MYDTRSPGHAGELPRQSAHGVRTHSRGVTRFLTRLRRLEWPGVASSTDQSWACVALAHAMLESRPAVRPLAVGRRTPDSFISGTRVQDSRARPRPGYDAALSATQQKTTQHRTCPPRKACVRAANDLLSYRCRHTYITALCSGGGPPPGAPQPGNSAGHCPRSLFTARVMNAALGRCITFLRGLPGQRIA